MEFPPAITAQKLELSKSLGISWKSYSDDLDQLLHLRWLGYQPSIIFDIGSSNTVWSAMAWMVFPQARFHLFEPLAELSDAYSAGKRQHPAICRFLENATYRIHPVALGQTNGRCAFRWFDGDAGSTSLPMKEHGSAAKSIDLPMLRLDDLVMGEKLPWPDLIKLDTQGSELEILRGASLCLEKSKIVFLECWLTKGYGPETPLFLDMANLLYQSGYDLFGIGGEFRDDNGLAVTKDAVFVKRSLVLEPTMPLLPDL